MTFRQKIDRILAYSSIVTAVTAMVLALIAIIELQQQQNCTNNILGQRSAHSDTPALIEAISAGSVWSQSLLAQLTAPPPTNTRDEQAIKGEFVASFTTYTNALTDAASQLVANQAWRSAHPLGQC